MPKLEKGTVVKAVGTKNKKEVKIKRVGDLWNTFHYLKSL
jgi:hypothetical protein